MRYLLVEGITDVKFIKYICYKNGVTTNFDDFKKAKGINAQIDIYKYNNLHIINIKGQEKLESTLSNILSPTIEKIEKIAIIQDADNDFKISIQNIKDAVKNSKIDNRKIEKFLTPNNKDLGDLETLLLSTIQKNPIVECFDNYKECLISKQDIYEKALNKGQVYAYTMYSQKGENLHKPQDSFMYKYDKKYIDTKLWDLEKKEFQPIIKFILEIFKNN